MNKFVWISYAIAIAVWNTILTGVITTICNIAYACAGKPLSSTLDIIVAYIFGYIVLFILNIHVIDEEGE